jgi:hypothetical protein
MFHVAREANPLEKVNTYFEAMRVDMRDDVVTTQMRFPADVWAWLSKQSTASVRSRNGEVVWMIRRRMEQEQETQQDKAVR